MTSRRAGDQAASGHVWGAYLRISEDPDDTREGVGRQREDCEAAVAALGGDPAAIRWYVENDTSAYKKRRVAVADPTGRQYFGYRVIRPLWHEALHDLRTRGITALVVWDLDRLARDNRDLEDAIETAEYYGAMIVSGTASDIDLTTSNGQSWARMLVTMANKSSADTARRVVRKHLQNAQDGKPVGGTRPFGWDDDKATVREPEAALIRQAAADVLAGVPLQRIAAEWNAAGATTSRGNAWRGALVRQVLRSPRLAGWRIHRGAVALGRDGAPVRGQWTPILDDATHKAVVAALAKPEGRTRVPRRGARHYLLTGLLRCGVCNAPMYGNRVKGSHYYRCSGGGHINSASGRGVDEWVEQVVLRRLAAVDLDRPAPTFTGQERLDQVNEQIAELMAAFTAGTLSGGVVFPAVGELEAERDRLAAERDEVEAAALRSDLTRLDAEAWQAMDTDRRRAVCEALLSAVLVRPTRGSTGNRFDRDRLEAVWRSS